MSHNIVGEVWLRGLGWVPVPLRTESGGGGVAISRRRKSGGALPDPATCSVTIDNASNDWSPRNARGLYFGLLTQNTPFRLTVDGQPRYYGEVPAWSPRWSLSERNRWVPVEVAGILRRLLASRRPTRSPMRRSYLASNPVAYWALEDGAESTVLASALPGHPPMTVDGPFTIPDLAGWEENSGQTYAYGTDRLVDVAGGAVLSAAVPPAATAATAAGFTAVVTSEAYTVFGTAVDQVLLELETPGGTFVRWQLFSPTVARTQVRAFTAAGAMTLVIDQSGVSSSLADRWLAIWQDGAVIRAGYGTLNASGNYDITGSVAGTLTGPVRLSVNTGRAVPAEPWPVGHIALWPGHNLAIQNPYVGDLTWALTAYAFSLQGSTSVRGERAVDRLARLCAEEGIPLTVIGDPGAPDPESMMGPQTSATFGALVEECVAVDGGLLSEARDALGLVYRPRASLYNQVPAVTLSYRAGHVAAPFDVADDDDQVANDVTVARVNGSSYRLVDDTSRMSVNEPDETPPGIGRYEDASARLNLSGDDQLPAHTGWRLRLGTADEPRYESITANLAGSAYQADPVLTAAVLDVDHGDLVAITDLPDWLPPGPVLALVHADDERVDTATRTVTWSAGPGSVWTVAVADGDPRVPADGTVLAAGITAGAGSWSFTSTATNGAWSALPADYPLDVRIGGVDGELVRFPTPPTGAGLTQTATGVVRSLNGVVRAWPAGTTLDVAVPAVLGL